MADSKDKLQQDITNKESYLNSSSAAFNKEIALFEQFFDKISNHAKAHRQITINNLDQVEERLIALKEQAASLKDQIFFHDETVIVDRQEIIAETEIAVHERNTLLLDNDRFEGNDILEAIDYLNKALIQVKMNFFETYHNSYLNSIMTTDIFFDFYYDKSKEFQSVLEQHQQEVMDLFLELNEEIKNMDDAISNIMQKKNETIQRINLFYKQEMKHYVDNQLMFSAVTDPTSIDIQALVSDKIVQFKTFRSHLEEQNKHIETHMRKEFQTLNKNVLTRLFNRKSNLITGQKGFFDNPETYLLDLTQQIVQADEQNDKTLSRRLIAMYLQLKDYRLQMKKCAKRAAGMVKKQRLLRNKMLLQFKLETNRITNDLERTLNLYQELMQYDTFLAQAIGDDSSKIVKDELNYLSLLAMNKEFKTNINFDIESQTIKGQINEVEMKLIYQVKKQLLLQEVELLDVIKDAQIFLIDRKHTYYDAKKQIEKERFLIDRLETAMNYHLEYMHEIAKINRKWNSEVLHILISDIRNQETHNIHIVDAAARVKLALKEYDIKSLHFKTMYENELNYLVMQSSRVEKETKIHNDFILSTYENQMRFTSEQIELASSEYRLRVEAIIQAVDEERKYLEEIYRNTAKKYDKRRQLLDDAFQSILYHNNHMLTETADEKIHKILNKEIDKARKQYFLDKTEIEAEYAKDKTIAETKRKLRELDSHLEDALQDADQLRVDTIQEMQEQFAYAKEHYEVLKPYLDQKVNILDPTFYNGLENINKRYRYKLKVAEVELDDASKDLLDTYLNIYFTEKPAENKQEMLQKIEELNTLRESASLKYSARMQALEDAYQAELADYQSNSDIINQETISIKNSIISKRDLTMHTIQTELDQVDQQYILQQKNHELSHTFEIRSLTSEYQKALISNQHFRETLNVEFEHLMNSYKPYIRLIRHNRDIQDVFRSVNRKARKKVRKEQKKIIKNSRTYPVI